MLNFLNFLKIIEQEPLYQSFFTEIDFIQHCLFHSKTTHILQSRLCNQGINLKKLYESSMLHFTQNTSKEFRTQFAYFSLNALRPTLKMNKSKMDDIIKLLITTNYRQLSKQTNVLFFDIYSVHTKIFYLFYGP